MADKARTTLQGRVKKVVESSFPGECEKAEIAVEGADHFCKKIGIENTLAKKSGQKPGATVEVTITAGPEAIPESNSKTFDEGSRVVVRCSELNAKGKSEDIPQLGTVALAPGKGGWHYLVKLDAQIGLKLVNIDFLSAAPSLPSE